ncbi:hypothetical protein G647_01439 [Cladophialophora carrionii CBS 160.54]|uniref:Uncharacterized protein n=1 Tax=Cladophialophora carrionii CBS 160.54 TaxID=1279043 RepID=V9DSP7_9EURO|nr:uncharacterized protein G647_01439 [Cladophialophora carrionii CBS 160.54]ETI28987.1 hypothetical protein G647_01439 [Cladophialophora carrionii CBS 160.54]
MEPLSALALSCNILDVVTAAGKTCFFLVEVHKAGAFPNHDELVSTTNLLDKSVQALTQQLSNAHGVSQTCQADDKELLDISQRARKLASDLQKKLDALKLQTTDSRSKRFEKVVKTVLQKGKIYDLERRWKELREAVGFALTVRSTINSEKNATNTNDRFVDVARQLTQGLSHLNTISAEVKHESVKTRLAITDETQSIRAKVAAEAETGRHHTSHEVAKGRAVSKAEAQRTRQHITIESTSNRVELRNAHRSTVGQVGRRIDLAHQKTRSQLQNRLESMRKVALDEKTRLRFINSFKIPELNERRHQISDAHPRTYEWIFAENLETQYPATTGIRRSWDSFTDWLLSSSPMYWIHGKAGSGKSTLMHFMSKHEKTQKLLDKWARPRTAIVLSWYFWNSGSQAQRSLKGALCALLYQLVSIHPEIATEILRKEPLLGRRDTAADWSEADLINLAPKMFSTFNGHIAVFIDGLDEFDRDEDIKALFDLLHSLTKTSRVKICFSSRPERQLELELGHLPQLRLQDMTSHDMKHYITDRLRPAFPHWSSIEINDFVEKIVHKADGVFLWVYLVTKNLQQGSLHSDSYGVLLERLEVLPAKMEALYEHMWRSLNGDEHLPTYRRQAALFFSFHAHFPLSLVDFVLATDEDLCGMASDMTQADIVTNKLHKACVQMHSLLQTRCAGLLEIGPQKEATTRIPRWLYRECEADFNLLTAKFETDSNDMDQTVRLSRALKNLGTVRFFHRTARDFLLDKPAGQELMKQHSLSGQDMAQRLLKARLATRLSGIYHPAHFQETKHWRWFERVGWHQMVSLIGDLDKSGADEQVAEFQYKLLQLIDTTYRQKLIPRWHKSIDPASRRNWFLAIAYPSDPLDLWGAVMSNISSSALTTRILQDGPGDKEFATYLLYELCRKEEYMQADLRSVRVLLGAGANPNATDKLSSKSGRKNSLWHRFVIRFMKQAREKPTESIDQAMQAQGIATVKCFLHHGADLFERAVVVRSLDITICTETILQIGLNPSYPFAGLRAGDIFSAVNGAYLLRRLSLTIPDACREGKLEEFTTRGDVAPLRQDLAIADLHGMLYRLSSDDPDPLQEMIATRRSGRRDRESIVSTLAPQFFHSDRQVRLCVLLEEQACAPEVKTKIEDGQSRIDSLKWSFRYQAAKRVRTMLHFCVDEMDDLFFPDAAGKMLARLSNFRDRFGLLAESTLAKHELETVEESFWPKFCKVYDEHLGRLESQADRSPGSYYPLTRLNAEIHDMADMLRSHGFKKLGFTGTQFALDNEGRRIPFCSRGPLRGLILLSRTQEEPPASYDSSQATDPEQGRV